MASLELGTVNDGRPSVCSAELAKREGAEGWHVEKDVGFRRWR